MYYTYIIESETTKKLYIGQTNDINDRLYRHNANQNLATKKKGPWKLLYFKEFQSRAEAVQLERKLKAWKNPAKVRQWILTNP